MKTIEKLKAYINEKIFTNGSKRVRATDVNAVIKETIDVLKEPYIVYPADNTFTSEDIGKLLMFDNGVARVYTLDNNNLPTKQPLGKMLFLDDEEGIVLISNKNIQSFEVSGSVKSGKYVSGNNNGTIQPVINNTGNFICGVAMGTASSGIINYLLYSL